MKTCIAALSLAGALLTAAAPAGAVTVVNATNIRVTSAMTGLISDSYLQIGELLAYDFGNTNVALTGVPTALSQYSGTSQPNEANDGVYPAAYDFGGPGQAGIYHSLGATSAEFLNIALQSPTTLQRLTIYGRTDCCTYRDSYNVSIFGANNTLLYSGQLDATANGFATVTFDAPSGAVPEPAAWSLMILGFGAAGAMLRTARRRSQAVTA